MKLNIPGFRRRERGVAAIELAFLLPILVIILAPLLVWARYMWHYTVVHRAAQDAARFMSTVPRTEMNSRILAGRARDVATEIVMRELSDLAPADEISEPEIECDTNDCGIVAGAPRTVRVLVFADFNDPIFNTYLGPKGLTITSEVTMNYVGK